MKCMRGSIYQRVLWCWRKCGHDDCDGDGDCGDVGNEDDGGVDNTVTENVRARLRNRNLTNERKFLLNFESRQIPCDIFANSLPGYFWSQFFANFLAAALRSIFANIIVSLRRWFVQLSRRFTRKIMRKGLPSLNVDNLMMKTDWKVYKAWRKNVRNKYEGWSV